MKIRELVYRRLHAKCYMGYVESYVKVK